MRHLALILDAMSGADRRDPLGITPIQGLSTVVERPSGVVRIGYDPDLGGRLPVDGGIAKVITGAVGDRIIRGRGRNRPDR